MWRLYVRDNGRNLRMAFYRKFNITHWAPVMGLLPFTLAKQHPPGYAINWAAKNCLRLSLPDKVTLYSPIITWISLKISCRHSRMFWDASDEGVCSVTPSLLNKGDVNVALLRLHVYSMCWDWTGYRTCISVQIRGNTIYGSFNWCVTRKKLSRDSFQTIQTVF